MACGSSTDRGREFLDEASVLDPPATWESAVPSTQSGAMGTQCVYALVLWPFPIFRQTEMLRGPCKAREKSQLPL